MIALVLYLGRLMYQRFYISLPLALAACRPVGFKEDKKKIKDKEGKAGVNKDRQDVSCIYG